MKLLGIGVSPEVRDIIKSTLKDAEWTTVDNQDAFGAQFETWADGNFHAILVGHSAGLDFMYEAGQVCRNQCPKTPLYALVNDKEQFFPKKIIKNGFNDGFLLPPDRERIKSTLMEVGAAVLSSKVYKRVKSFDIQPDSHLTFDTYVYLPLNNRHIKYSKANQKIDKKKVEKLAEHNVANLFIDNKEAESFYQYVATELSKTVKTGNFVSSTEREEKVGQIIRQVFTDVFDKESEGSFETGKEVLNLCQKIISSYVTDGKDSNMFTKLVRSVSGLSDDYTHSTETSTLASFFAMAMGIEKIDDIAIAAFFHDLGMIDTPDFDPENPEHVKNQELLKKYHEHPQRSLDYVKSKRMILSEKAQKAILCHQERFDGKGFPKGLAGDRVPLEAQIISLADQFQYLTRTQPNRKKLSPAEALEKIFSNGSINPDIARKIKSVLKMS